MACAALLMYLFLLTPLREGRLGFLRALIWRVAISTHAPAGGATRAICGSLPACGNFYSRPCGRGDIERRLEEWRREISTHAPAGGATIESRAACRLVDISTHAPAGGATTCAASLARIVGFISTHAPAGGATMQQNQYTNILLFLLTPLREGRLAFREIRCFYKCNFYSRPCGRGDQSTANL